MENIYQINPKTQQTNQPNIKKLSNYGYVFSVSDSRYFSLELKYSEDLTLYYNLTLPKPLDEADKISQLLIHGIQFNSKELNLSTNNKLPLIKDTLGN